MKKEKKSPHTDTQQRKQKKQMWSPAPSLKSGKTAIEAAAKIHPYAVAIREARRFRAPATKMSSEAYKRHVERSSITFGG